MPDENRRTAASRNRRKPRRSEDFTVALDELAEHSRSSYSGHSRLIERIRIGQMKGSHRQFHHPTKRGTVTIASDLPGCVAAADTRDEVVKLIREAIDPHLGDMRAKGERPPKPSSEGEMVEVDAA